MKVEVERLRIIQGDALEKLRELPDEVCHCVCTSPPYWGLRDYGIVGQLGLEKTPEEYIAKMVAVFEEVRRVLRRDGTLWLNMGDCYAEGKAGRTDHGTDDPTVRLQGNSHGAVSPGPVVPRKAPPSLKPKDLCGMPWRVAFALQAAGWWLRSEIIWAKRSAMPESVTDRPTKSHEQVFLLAKSQTYFYDAEAVKVPASDTYANDPRWDTGGTEVNYKDGYAEALAQNPKAPHRVFNGERRATVNLRDVWLIGPEPFPDSHFAVFPTSLVKPCILAGTSARGCCPKCGAPWERVVEKGESMWESRKANGAPMRAGDVEGGRSLGAVEPQFSGAKLAAWKAEHPDKTTGWQPTCECGESSTVPCTVLDPFAGSFTTCAVALELGRRAIGIELNPKYVEMGKKRCDVTPGLPLA